MVVSVIMVPSTVTVVGSSFGAVPAGSAGLSLPQADSSAIVAMAMPAMVRRGVIMELAPLVVVNVRLEREPAR